MTVSSDAAPRESLVHEGFFYRDVDEFLAVTVPFVRDGLIGGHPVLVAVPKPRVDLLRDELGGDADEVRFLDMATAGRNPNRIIPWVLRAFVDEFPDRPVRIIGEPIWPGRAPAEIPVCVQHEAMINVALADTRATVLCPYDAARLHPGVLMYAGRTHPVLIVDGARGPHEGYAEPTGLVALLNQPLPDPPEPVTEVTVDLTGLAGMRLMVAEAGRQAGLARDLIVDLQLAVNEIATNAVVHGRGVAVVRVWLEADRVVCEVRGPGEITDWMAGRMRPADTSERGRGLLLANRMCDLVQTYTCPDGTTTRLHMRR